MGFDDTSIAIRQIIIQVYRELLTALAMESYDQSTFQGVLVLIIFDGVGGRGSFDYSQLTSLDFFLDSAMLKKRQ